MEPGSVGFVIHFFSGSMSVIRDFNLAGVVVDVVSGYVPVQATKKLIKSFCYKND